MGPTVVISRGLAGTGLEWPSFSCREIRSCAAIILYYLLPYYIHLLRHRCCTIATSRCPNLKFSCQILHELATHSCCVMCIFNLCCVYKRQAYSFCPNCPFSHSLQVAGFCLPAVNVCHRLLKLFFEIFARDASRQSVDKKQSKRTYLE